jgi:hypothetical protein
MLVKTANRIIIFSIIGAFFLLTEAKAQQIHPNATGYYFDAFKYSQTNIGGTARTIGLAGAGTALGGDMGSIFKNPAGLGFHRNSELNFSPSFNFANTQTNMLNQRQRDSRQTFNLGQMGAVFSDIKEDITPGFFRGGAFAVNMTKINNFNNQYSYSARNDNTSISDYFADIAQGYHFEDDLNYPPVDIIDLALLSNVIYADGTNRNYFTFNRGLPSLQEETVLTRGAMTQWDIAYGGNFDDRVYLGASMGITRIRNFTEKTFSETVIYEPGEARDVLNMTFYDQFETRGTGVNFKMGTIIRPVDWVRFGASIQSPTYFTVTDEYSYFLSSRFAESQYNQAESTPLGIYRYYLNTPMRINGGVAVFAGKSGFVTADVEYVAYNTATLRDPENNFLLQPDNQTIKSIFRPTFNMNVGGEYRMDIYRLRGGFAYIGDPFEDGVDDVNRSILNVSVGAGVRLPDYYFDAAIVNSRYNSVYSPYTLSYGGHPTARVSNRNTNFIMTFGLFF